MEHKYVATIKFTKGVKWQKRFEYFAGIISWINSLGRLRSEFGEVDKLVVKRVSTGSTVEHDEEDHEVFEM